ncbi:MAG: hypothetical protein HY744_22130 [Deltaproteobacteria bacterium]|nr:hypothetical protein [Deltaproteobacteria bacterium]
MELVTSEHELGPEQTGYDSAWARGAGVGRTLGPSPSSLARPGQRLPRPLALATTSEPGTLGPARRQTAPAPLSASTLGNGLPTAASGRMGPARRRTAPAPLSSSAAGYQSLPGNGCPGCSGARTGAFGANGRSSGGTGGEMYPRGGGGSGLGKFVEWFLDATEWCRHCLKNTDNKLKAELLVSCPYLCGIVKNSSAHWKECPDCYEKAWKEYFTSLDQCYTGPCKKGPSSLLVPPPDKQTACGEALKGCFATYCGTFPTQTCTNCCLGKFDVCKKQKGNFPAGPCSP